jgi:hypothetical protein
MATARMALKKTKEETLGIDKILEGPCALCCAVFL